MHLLLFLPLTEYFRDATRVDEIILAEFPIEDQDPTGTLFDIVASVMVHGLCGDLDSYAKCMQIDPKTGCKKYCKGFPKLFQLDTMIRDDRYLLYHRRNNRQGYTIPHPLFEGQEYKVTNEWVVPYNSFLTCKYHAHINVEGCGSVKAIKYIHEYIYKGSNCATMEINGVNEISRHADGQYIGSTEAIWHLMEFPMHAKWLFVTELTLHTPGQQVVYF